MDRGEGDPKCKQPADVLCVGQWGNDILGMLTVPTLYEW